MARKNHHSSKAPRRKKYQARQKDKGGGLAVVAARHGETVGELLRQDADFTLVREDITEVNMKYWMALDKIKRGAGNEEALGYLVTGVNMTLGLCEQGLGEEHLQLVIQALEAIHRSMQRVRGGIYLLDGDGVRAIQETLAVHDAQMEIATERQILAAQRIIDERIAAGQTYAHQPELAEA